MTDPTTPDSAFDRDVSTTEEDFRAAESVARTSPGWAVVPMTADETRAFIGVVPAWGEPGDGAAFAYYLTRDDSGGIQLWDLVEDRSVGFFPDARQAMLAAIRRGSPRERWAAGKSSLAVTA